MFSVILTSIFGHTASFESENPVCIVLIGRCVSPDCNYTWLLIVNSRHDAYFHFSTPNIKRTFRCVLLDLEYVSNGLHWLYISGKDEKYCADKN